MKIVQLKADNFKRLVAVEITPEGDLVLLSGKNDSGKSSVLDAIWAALGGARACPGKPIREGAEKSQVRLVLDNGLVVERTFTQNDSYLRVTADDGRQRFTKPQDMLDALIGKIAFDPLAFARKKPKDQVAELLNVVDIGLDLEAYELERQALYDKRADANREVKRLEGAIAKLPPWNEDNVPDEAINGAALATELAELERENVAVYAARKRAQELEGEISRLQAELEHVKATAARDPRDADIKSLKETIASAEGINTLVRVKKQYFELNAEFEAAKAVAGAHDAEIKAHDAKKETALAAAKFPVPGLSFNDEGILYNGIPFAQCSSSEQLKVAVAVAMAANPDLRVIQIREGSLLDQESLAVIKELAGEYDYQVWVEVVDESGEVGVVIEDGMVAAKAGATAAAGAPAKG